MCFGLGRLPSNQKCKEKISKSLLVVLFKKQCPLCASKLDLESNPSSMVDCALEHNFCVPCLELDTLTQLDRGLPPKCPRSAECKFVFEEADVRQALAPCPAVTIDARLFQWHEVVARRGATINPAVKSCPMPNCTGFLCVSEQVTIIVTCGDILTPLPSHCM